MTDSRCTVMVTEDNLKPGMSDAFQEFYRKETRPAYEKAGYKQVSVYTTATFGELGEFVTIRPIGSEKHFDQPNFLVKALGEAGAKTWIARRAQLVASTRSFLMQSRPELSLPAPPNQTAKLAFVFRQSVAPGRAADFESFIRNDALPIIKKAAPKGYFVAKVGIGGDTDEYHTVVLPDSFAEHEKWEQALVKEGYVQMAAKRAGIVMRRESAVYRYIPELSLPQPASQQAAK